MTLEEQQYYIEELRNEDTLGKLLAFHTVKQRTTKGKRKAYHRTMVASITNQLLKLDKECPYIPSHNSYAIEKLLTPTIG